MILTGKQILHLARIVGLEVEDCDDLELLDTEMWVTETNGYEIIDDKGTRQYYEKVTHFYEYPEEGFFGIGSKIGEPQKDKTPNN